jgi:hypothetical protein
LDIKSLQIRISNIFKNHLKILAKFLIIMGHPQVMKDHSNKNALSTKKGLQNEERGQNNNQRDTMIDLLLKDHMVREDRQALLKGHMDSYQKGLKGHLQAIIPNILLLHPQIDLEDLLMM